MLYAKDKKNEKNKIDEFAQVYLAGQTDPKMAIVRVFKTNRFQSGFRDLKKKIKQNKQ